MAQNSGNPWAMRVTIIGLVFILLGSIAIFSNVDKIDDAASPKKINEASQTGDGSVTVELSKSCSLQMHSSKCSHEKVLYIFIMFLIYFHVDAEASDVFL